jgi:hypothetical protein
MFEQKCNKCDKLFTHKGDYDRHVKRKKSCGIELSDNLAPEVSPSDLHNILHNDKKITHLPNYTCNMCNLGFSRKDNLIRHQNDRCKIEKNITDINGNSNKDIIQVMLIEMKQLREQNKIALEQNKLLLDELMKSKQNVDKQLNVDKQMNVDKQIVNNNVKLIAFGKEDMSCITDNICKQILSKGFQAVPKLIEHMHFNKDKPEYQNIYIPNFRNNMAMIFDGDDWGIRDRDEALDQLKNEKAEFLTGKFNELLRTGQLSEPTIKKMRRFIKEKDEDPADTNIKNDIKLLLYNKRNLVINNKKTRSKNDKLIS